MKAIKVAGITESLQAELERCETRKTNLVNIRREFQQSPPSQDRLPTEAEITSALEGFRCLLESGTHQEKRALLEENIEAIIVRPDGEILLKENPAGLLPSPVSIEWEPSPRHQ